MGRDRLSRYERSATDLLFDAAGATAFLLGLTLVITSWPDLPDSIPVHFGLDGTPDRWGSPATVLILPAIGLVLYVLLTVVSRFPHHYNYPWAVSPDDVPRQHRLAIRLVQTLNIAVQLLFASIVWTTAAHAHGQPTPGGGWLFPLFLVLIFLAIILYVIAARPRRG